MTAAEIKPTHDFAPPPVSAVISVLLFMSASIHYFPTFDHADPKIFIKRIFPDLLSVDMLLYIRLFFVLVGFRGFYMAWLFPPLTVTPPYRPHSKVPKIPILMKGWKKQFPFTAWSWNLLTLHFALSSFITFQVNRGHSVTPWIVQVALLLWEISAPVTFLIGAVVKFALWPAAVKSSGHGGAFLTPRALLQHNGNVIMAMTEAALMGGLPVRYSHIATSILYGSVYILFTWAIQMTWHGQGPAFIYFFMDTTLGDEHTVAIWALVGTLFIFHGLFCGVELILAAVGNHIWGHLAVVFVLCAMVCRFRD